MTEYNTDIGSAKNVAIGDHAQVHVEETHVYIVPPFSSAHEPRPSISPPLLASLRNTLLRCGPRSSRRVGALFVDARIAPWADCVPDLDNPRALVNDLIAALAGQRNTEGESALVLFLRALSDTLASEDACHRDLVTLAHELEMVFAEAPDATVKGLDHRDADAVDVGYFLKQRAEEAYAEAERVPPSEEALWAAALSLLLQMLAYLKENLPLKPKRVAQIETLEADFDAFTGEDFKALITTADPRYRDVRVRLGWLVFGMSAAETIKELWEEHKFTAGLVTGAAAGSAATVGVVKVTGRLARQEKIPRQPRPMPDVDDEPPAGAGRKARPSPARQPYEPEMIYIPAGPFWMGSDEHDEWAWDDEKPRHRVVLPDYYIAKTPVTNAQYAFFVHETGHRIPRHWKEGGVLRAKRDHPVVYVSWHDAVAYCEWLAEMTGKPYRLPTEAQWEKAARGPDGRIYPWGDVWDVGKCNNWEGGERSTTLVGRYSPQGDSYYGCVDMAGNVWEWTSSLKRDYPYRADDGREDMYADGARVVRGGSFYSDRYYARCAHRYGSCPDYVRDNFGFRVCVSPSRSGL